MKPRSVTLADVAAAAGVSYQTVSRVLNHAESVAQKTRQKVQASMKALNYVPNLVAQQLAGKKNRTLGLATSDLALLAPAQMASAIQHRASALGYRLVIAMAGNQGTEMAVQELLAQRVDALLINLPLDSANAVKLATSTGYTPCLFLDVPDNSPVPACQFSAETGARKGVEHLLSLGHRQIALLNGPESSVAAVARRQGWLAVLKEHQLRPYAEWWGDWSAESGYRTMLSLCGGDLPQAIVVANDQMALGVLRALHQTGLAIPEDISVVGYDDTVDSAWYQPPLTTIRQDIRLLGERSVDWLVQKLNDAANPPLLAPFAPELIVRETTAVPGTSRTSVAKA